MNKSKSREKFEIWMSNWVGIPEASIRGLRNPDERDMDTYTSEVISDEALKFFIVGFAAWEASRKSIEGDNL